MFFFFSFLYICYNYSLNLLNLKCFSLCTSRKRKIESIHNRKANFLSKWQWFKASNQVQTAQESIIFDHQCLFAITFNHGNGSYPFVSEWWNSFCHNNYAGSDCSTLFVHPVSKQSIWHSQNCLFEEHWFLEYVCNNCFINQFLYTVFVGNHAEKSCPKTDQDHHENYNTSYHSSGCNHLLDHCWSALFWINRTSNWMLFHSKYDSSLQQMN